MKVFLPIVGKDYRLKEEVKVKVTCWSDKRKAVLESSDLFITRETPDSLIMRIPKDTRLRFNSYQQVSPNRARHLRWLTVEFFLEDKKVKRLTTNYKLLENDTFGLDIEPWQKIR